MSFRGHERLVVDTAPLISFLTGDPARAPLVRSLLLAATEGGVSLVVSALTEAELLVAPLRSDDPDAASAVRALLEGAADITVADVTRSIAQDAAELRADLGLSLIDAVVAATALATGCTALVANDLAFRNLGAHLQYLHLDDLST